MASGAVTIGDLLVNESETGDRFLSWKTASTDDLTFTVAPNQLRIKEIRVTEPGAKVVIAKDRSLNLVHVLRTETEAARTAPVATPDGPRRVGAAAPSAKRPEPGSEPLDARVARVSVRDGTVDFADLSLVLPFSTRITRFSGTAVGISTERTARTEVKFRGRIEPSGFASVEGGLSAYDPKAFTDIRVEFRNVEMPPLSPYTATFAGRAVAAGRLSLELSTGSSTGCSWARTRPSWRTSSSASAWTPRTRSICRSISRSRSSPTPRAASPWRSRSRATSVSRRSTTGISFAKRSPT